MQAPKRVTRWLDSSSPFVCNIFSRGVGREAFLFNDEPGPLPGAPPVADPAAPPADAPPAKVFTQADIDAIAGKIKADAKKQFADYETLKTQALKTTDLERKLSELTASLEDSKLSAEEQKRAAAQRAAAQIEAKQVELEQKARQSEEAGLVWKTKFMDGEISRSIGASLDNNNVLQAAKADAILLLKSAAKIDHDEDGKIILIELGGASFTNTQDAAVAFLKARPHLVSAGRPPVGGGSGRPNGGGKDLSTVSADALISQGMAARKL